MTQWVEEMGERFALPLKSHEDVMSTFGPDQYPVRHFQMRELECHCPDPDCKWKKFDDIGHARSMSFFLELSRLRELWGGPLVVTSGMRCPAWNAEQGGAAHSAHLYRVAADVYPEQGMWYDLALWAEKMAVFSGIIAYPVQCFIHLDMHPDDWVRRGHSYGPDDEYVTHWGKREGSPLSLVTEWNIDYAVRKPDYVREAEDRMRL